MLITKKTKKSSSFSKKAAFRGALFLTLSGLMVGCGSSDSTPVNKQDDWGDSKTKTTAVAKQDFTKGVITTVEEVKKGEFKIVDEQTVPKKEESQTIVKYFDGKVDTLNALEIKSIAEKEKEASYSGSNSSLGNVMWWGLMGYMVGRSFNSRPNPGVYNNQKTYQRVNTTTNTSLMNSRRTVTPSWGNNAQKKAPGAAPATTSKPANAKKGFFNSGAKSSGSSSSSKSFGG